MSSRKKYRPKPVTLNALQRAIEGASTLPKHHQEHIVMMLRRAWDEILAGRISGQALCDLAYGGNMAGEFSGLGICSDADSVRKTETAQSIIERIARAQAAKLPIEIAADDDAAMDEALFLWQVQLQFVSHSEFERARAAVNRALADAKRGILGKKTTLVKFDNHVNQ